MSEAYDETYESSSTSRDHRRCDLRDYRRHRRNDRGLHRQFFRHSLHASHAPEFNDHNRLILLGGLSFLTMRKWGAALGMIFVAAELLGRVHFVATGISPASGDDAIKIIISGVIALTIIVYVSSQWDKFN